MDKKIVLASAVFLLLIFTTNIQPTESQDFADLLGAFNFTQKVQLIADLLLHNEGLFNQLEHILVAALPITHLEDPDRGLFMHAVFPWALDHLPDFLKSYEFMGIARIFINDLNRVNYSYWGPEVLAHRDVFVNKLFSELNYLKMLQDILTLTSVRDVLPYDSSLQLKEQCYNDTMDFFDRLIQLSPWAIDMFDAAGKPTTGINKGVMHFIGTYDECLNTHAHIRLNDTLGPYHSGEDKSFDARYCRATIPVPRSLAKSIAGDNINNTYGIPLTLTLGLCLPDSCHKQDIPGLTHLGFLGWLNLTITDSYCNEDSPLSENKPGEAVIGIIAGLILLVLLATLVDAVRAMLKTESDLHGYDMSDLNKTTNNDYELEEHIHVNDAYEPETPSPDDDETKRTSKEVKHSIKVIMNGEAKSLRKTGIFNKNKEVNGIGIPSTMTSELESRDDTISYLEHANEGLFVKLQRSFSVYTSIASLLKTKLRDRDIPCLHGIRFLSMTWIMLGNTYIYTALSIAEAPVAVNLMDTFTIMKRFTFQAVLSATLASDTFFMISGCLITYWYLHRLNTKYQVLSLKTWLKFYLGKYWKMTPPYMLVMVTMTYLYMHLGQGPLWPKNILVADRCRKNWWKHLLYVNNLVGTNGHQALDQCMPWSWQLAVTMQFYLISPIVISFMAVSPVLGVSLTGILAVAGIVSAGEKEYHYPGDMLTSSTDGGDYWNNVFTKPWCRVAAYCVGMMLGFFLNKYSHKKINKLIAAGLWLLFAAIGVLIVYCPFTRYMESGTPWTDVQMAVYEALSRPFWALCVAWVVFACATKGGGPVNSFLSWSGFVPLSRLTFMAYLLHPVIMVLVVYSRRSLAYINDFDMAYLFLGHLVVTYLGSFFLSLIFDAPFRNLKKVINQKVL